MSNPDYELVYRCEDHIKTNAAARAQLTLLFEDFSKLVDLVKSLEEECSVLSAQLSEYQEKHESPEEKQANAAAAEEALTRFKTKLREVERKKLAADQEALAQLNLSAGVLETLVEQQASSQGVPAHMRKEVPPQERSIDEYREALQATLFNLSQALMLLLVEGNRVTLPQLHALNGDLTRHIARIRERQHELRTPTEDEVLRALKGKPRHQKPIV